MPGSYSQFLDALGQRESGSSYAAVNRAGYLGKYQFGEAALTDIGYYTSDSTPTVNDWQAGSWTGKDGITSEAQFLADPAVQDSAVHAYMAKLWSYLEPSWHFAGQIIDGTRLTVSGMLAGAFLVGAGAENKYLSSDGASLPSDGNSTTITSYVDAFDGYYAPFRVDHDGAEILTAGAGADHLFGYGGNDTLIGGSGNDTLTGGAGSDIFRFDGPSAAGDTITDFHPFAYGPARADHIELNAVAFGAHAGDPLELISGSGALKADTLGQATILYAADTGSVYFDPDGSGPAKATLVATLANHPAHLGARDFTLV